MSDVFKPLTNEERNIVVDWIRQHSHVLSEGEFVTVDWEDTRNIENIGRRIWHQRVWEWRPADPNPRHLPPPNEDLEAFLEEPAFPEKFRSSTDWHQGMTNPPGPVQFRQFFERFIKPVYYEHHPLKNHRLAGEQILGLIQIGKIGFNGIVEAQIQQIAQSGTVTTSQRTGGRRFVPPLRLLNTLINLAEPMRPAKGRNQKPFFVLSLLRFRDQNKKSQTSYHRSGRAIDITRYAGHRIDMRWPLEAFDGVIQLIRNLPRGRYQMGLPRVPSESNVSDLTARYRLGRGGRSAVAVPVQLRERTKDYEQFRHYYLSGQGRPIFKPQYRSSNSQYPWGLPNPFLDRRLQESRSPGKFNRDIQRFESRHYARQFEREVKFARRTNGAIVADLFPDKPNHLHLSLLDDEPP